jgi:hypothetical protein
MIYTNSKGVKYYLSKKIVTIGWNKNATVPTYFFRREKREDYCPELPPNLTVVETHSGLPIVKSISKKVNGGKIKKKKKSSK